MAVWACGEYSTEVSKLKAPEGHNQTQEPTGAPPLKRQFRQVNVKNKKRQY